MFVCFFKFKDSSRAQSVILMWGTHNAVSVTHCTDRPMDTVLPEKGCWKSQGHFGGVLRVLNLLSSTIFCVGQSLATFWRRIWSPGAAPSNHFRGKLCNWGVLKWSPGASRGVPHTSLSLSLVNKNRFEVQLLRNLSVTSSTASGSVFLPYSAQTFCPRRSNAPRSVCPIGAGHSRDLWRAEPLRKQDKGRGLQRQARLHCFPQNE